MPTPTRYNKHMHASPEPISATEFDALAEFRYQVRLFLRAAERNALSAGIKSMDYQFLLSLKRTTPRAQVNLATFSERLNLSSRALIQLIETLVDRKLVERRRAGRGGPESFLHLTSKGEEVLHQVASLNRQELRARAADIIGALKTIGAR